MFERSAGTRYGYAQDTHGSTSLLIKPDGNAQATYRYTPYGGLDNELSRADTSSTDPLNPYRYSGKRLDTGSGTLDMGARRFLPGQGRYLQRDLYYGALSNLRLGLSRPNQNRYGLAGGNPIGYIELDGHWVVIGDGGGDYDPTEQAKLLADGYQRLGCGTGSGKEFVCEAIKQGVQQQLDVWNDRDQLCEQTRKEQHCSRGGDRLAAWVGDHKMEIALTAGALVLPLAPAVLLRAGIVYRSASTKVIVRLTITAAEIGSKVNLDQGTVKDITECGQDLLEMMRGGNPLKAAIRCGKLIITLPRRVPTP